MYVRFDIDDEGSIVVQGQLCDPFRDSKKDSPGRVAQIQTFLKKAHDVFHLDGADFIADCQSVAHGVDDAELDFHLHLVALYWQLPADRRAQRQAEVASVFTNYFGPDARLEDIHVGVVGDRRDSLVFDVFRMLRTVPDALLYDTAMDYCRRIARTPRYNEEQVAIRTSANTRLNLIRSLDDLHGASDELKAFLREGAWSRRNGTDCSAFVKHARKVASGPGGMGFLAALMQKLPRQHAAWAIGDLDFAFFTLGRRADDPSLDAYLLGYCHERLGEDEQARYLKVVLATQDAIHRRVDLGVFTAAANRLMPKIAAWPGALPAGALMESVRAIARAPGPGWWHEAERAAPGTLRRTSEQRRIASSWAGDLVTQWCDGQVGQDVAAPYDAEALAADMAHGDPSRRWSSQDIDDVFKVGLQSLLLQSFDMLDDTLRSLVTVDMARAAALRATWNACSFASRPSQPAFFDVRPSRALLARLHRTLSGAWPDAPENPTARNLRSHVVHSIRNGWQLGRLSYGNLGGMVLEQRVAPADWLACRASLQDCWVPEVKQLEMRVPGTDDWATQDLGPAQALALEVAPMSFVNSNLFVVRVKLWRRRRGTLALASVDTGLPKHMDRAHWYDTGVVCYTFWVSAGRGGVGAR